MLDFITSDGRYAFDFDDDESEEIETVKLSGAACQGKETVFRLDGDVVVDGQYYDKRV